MAAHTLLTKDPDTRRANCSECGDTGMVRKGTYWRCGSVNRSRVKARINSSPRLKRAKRERHRANRAGRPSPHPIMSRDLLTLTGFCLGCADTMPIYRNGRGWVCSENGYSCKCPDEVTWSYHAMKLCEQCCYALARAFVADGLLEPVLELTWPEGRTSWDQAVFELEG